MKTSSIITTGFSLSLMLLITACATGTGGATGLQAEYERTIPVCVGAADCETKMNAARDWIKHMTGFQLLVDNADRLETGGWGMPNYTAVRVDRAPIGSDRYWILVEFNCGNLDAEGANACLPYWESSVNFNQVVGAAH